MAFWRFKDYVTDEDKNHIFDWREAQTVPVQVAFEATLVTLAATQDWSKTPSFDVFIRKPQHLGLGQVKFYVIEARSKKINFRAVGLWRQEAHEFIFLTGFRKNGRSPIPENAFNLALDLRCQLEDGKGHTDDHV